MKNIKKILSSIIFKKKYISNKSIDTSYDKTKFREIAKTILGHTETKSIILDYQSSLRLIYNYNKIDLSNKSDENSKAVKENEVLETAEKENEKINSNFFNDFSLKILENSNKDNLLDLACKSFVGNTGVH
jgi:hypothetical protein